MDSQFWARVDDLVTACAIEIDRPQRAPGVDYGYLRETRGGDGEEVDVWVGSLPGRRVTGAIMTVDLRPGRHEVEVKLLVGCTPEEARRALHGHTPPQMVQTVVGAYLVSRD